MASIYIETFGCQMNEADSQYIAKRAGAAGYAIATQPQDADVVVLNTCTVRDNAERRAYGRMGHLKTLKDADPGIKLVVTGCLAEQDRDRMQTLAPYLDGVFGTSELTALGDAIERWRPDFADTEYTQERALIEPLGGAADCITDAFSHVRAFVTVQRGCSYYCTFCIVPHVRGRFDHRPIGEIVAEVEQKVAGGAREVMLVGQTVNAYKDAVSGADFGTLCETVCAISGLERLTFISPHPKDFTESMIARFARLPKLNPRVHLPLQSASNPILRRMNRKYTVEQFHEKVEFFGRYLPSWAITTDLIVAFPGESDADFEATRAYCERGIFAQAFMFVYSQRRGTPAASWEPVPDAVGKVRFARLMETQNAAVRAYNDRLLGKTVRGLIVGPSKKDASKLAMKTLDNVTVIAPKPPDFDEALYASEPWLDVAVETAHVWGATGRLIRRAARFDDAGSPVASPVLDLIRI